MTCRVLMRWGLLAACLTAGWLQAQTAERQYLRALPGYDYSFPRDHGAHREYKLEWWYFTGNLVGEAGERFGYELTFFRLGMDRVSANPSTWTIDDLYVAHFALGEYAEDSNRETFRFFERVNRAGPGIAGASEQTLSVRNGSWTASLGDDGAMDLRAYANGILLELELAEDKPPVIHGVDGVSQKADGAGQASHYYSMTRMETQGLVSTDGRLVRVSGESWMDHEFGTSQLAPNQLGWDWFGLQLDNGEELMLYQMRLDGGRVDPNSSGTIVTRNGQKTHLVSQAFSIESSRQWTSPQTGAIYPLDWRIDIPDSAIHLRVVPVMDNQEMATLRSVGFPYWEGAVRVEGVWRGVPVSGRGYVELTGYGENYRPDV